MSKAVVLYSYTPVEEDELTLTEGDILDIISSDDDWWECSDGQGRRGLVPYNYLRVMEENQDNLPPGWERFNDPDTGDPYFFHKEKGLR